MYNIVFKSNYKEFVCIINNPCTKYYKHIIPYLLYKKLRNLSIYRNFCLHNLQCLKGSNFSINIYKFIGDYT